MLSKVSGYVKTFDNFKLMSNCIDDDQLLEKYKSVQSKIEESKDIQINTDFFDLVFQKMKLNLIAWQSFLLILYLFTRQKLLLSIFR